MKLNDDGDSIRSVGYLALYGAYLEESIWKYSCASKQASKQASKPLSYFPGLRIFGAGTASLT